jgi:hypothetical protein
MLLPTKMEIDYVVDRLKLYLPRIEEDGHLNAARHINEAIAQLEALKVIAPEETG